jgi:hypothetical protein
MEHLKGKIKDSFNPCIVLVEYDHPEESTLICLHMITSINKFFKGLRHILNDYRIGLVISHD